jgi:hypothetical protein
METCGNKSSLVKKARLDVSGTFHYVMIRVIERKRRQLSTMSYLHRLGLQQSVGYENISGRNGGKKKIEL